MAQTQVIRQQRDDKPVRQNRSGVWPARRRYNTPNSLRKQGAIAKRGLSQPTLVTDRNIGRVEIEDNWEPWSKRV